MPRRAHHLRLHLALVGDRRRDARADRRRVRGPVRRALRDLHGRPLRARGPASHARVRDDRSAARRDRRGVPAPRGTQPRGALPRADHDRRRGAIADDLLAAPPARLLRDHRRWRRGRGGAPGPRARPQEAARATLGGCGGDRPHRGGPPRLSGLGGGADRAARARGSEREPRRHRHGDDLRLVHDHRARDARGSGLLQERRRGAVRRGRAARARRRAPRQHRRRRPLVESPGDARDLPRHRGGQAAPR